MARLKGKDIGMGRWNDAAIKRLWRLHKAGEDANTLDPAIKRPPELAKCEGHFVWSVRQAAFVGRQDDPVVGGHRHYVTCTAQARRYESVAQARAAGDALIGDVLILYGFGANAPLYIVGR
ncbi:hypothetical protein UC34_10245 [Pandoraea vervacti]|uniref:Uncharacterized protein n=1 Tax=Pandoraea vervacti TaxID=656178 RepID=A0ABM5SXN2_9BURK|nr:hypothetical protein [Pandoraea vervacti]AJP57284.1 hypothetical protein UC34_10245 [Pandoraea vervacti]